MLVKIYSIFLLVYFMMALNRSTQKEDSNEFILLVIGFFMWLPLIGRVFEFW
jgi:hypothetical protein